MQAQVLEGGFVNLPIDASYAFRAVMTAMARPGDIVDVRGAKPPLPMSIAAGVVVLTLCDPETPIHLALSHDTPQVRDWITFHTGAPIVAAQNAMFALGEWEALSLTDFPLGTAEYPDKSATVIVERQNLSKDGAVLRGPGIREKTTLSLPDSPTFETNKALFPLGLDFIFTCDDRLAALPRTTRVG
ncbi:MAG: alpha-D-ribose 1-methylphosphonate 5-triphosphate synthase subunit PhnH [Gammaproteobacteria bacterium]|jgi:alpha-D-ribose 1-methylphosphonate 5-triphosphate synthase subunit PhnH